jgi:cytosine/adenosine deaminase-related metal-dependent hydrolase
MARASCGPEALGVRQAVELATLGGAALVGRAAEIGSLEPGKLADIALWRLDGLAHANIADPVAALVLGARAPLELLLVNGAVVVERDRVVTVDETAVAAAARRAAGALAGQVG